MISASLLNFVAGLLAGAGLNLLTSAATAATREQAIHLVIMSIPWIAAAAFLARAASLAEQAHTAASLLITANHGLDERREMVKGAMEVHLVQFRLMTGIAVLLIAVASVLAYQMTKLS